VYTATLAWWGVALEKHASECAGKCSNLNSLQGLSTDDTTTILTCFELSSKHLALRLGTCDAGGSLNPSVARVGKMRSVGTNSCQ
jgi:hypothetical protein